MSKLLLAVPSRGRPANIARLASAMADTCVADTTLIIGLDEDDPTRPEYPHGIETEVRGNLRFVVPWTNELVLPRVDDYDFIGHIGDDNVPRTRGWDQAIIEALLSTPFAFANDLYPRAPGSLCCHVFMRSEVVKALGYFCLPSVKHMYPDVAWMAWGRATGITYLDDVIIEHMHYTVGKSVTDASYAASTGLMPADLAAYNDYCNSGGMNEDIRKIQAVTNPIHPAFQFTPDEMAEFNRTLNIPPRAREGWVPGESLWP